MYRAVRTIPDGLTTPSSIMEGLKNLRNKMREAKLKSTTFKNKVGYFGIDKGTIYKGMMAFVLVVDDNRVEKRTVAGGVEEVEKLVKRVLLWKIEPTDHGELYANGATAEAICKNIMEEIKDASKQGIDIRCVTTDNAANMRKSLNLAGVLRIPCHAHSAQLIGGDIIGADPRMIDIQAKARKFRLDALYESKHQVRLPAANETRWSSDERLMNSILRDREKISTPGVEPRISKELHNTLNVLHLQNFTNTLSPIGKYTNLVQRDNATLFEAIAGLGPLLNSPINVVAAATRNRITSTFLCDASLLFCFFNPAFSMNRFLKENGDDDDEKTFALVDLGACITGVLDGPAVTGLCKQLGIDPLRLKIEMSFSNNDTFKRQMCDIQPWVRAAARRPRGPRGPHRTHRTAFLARAVRCG